MSICLENAVKAYRNITGDKSKIPPLLMEIKEWNRVALGQMKGISTTINATDIISEVNKCLKYDEPHANIRALALSIRPQRKSKVETQIIESAKEYPLQHLFTEVALTSEGNISAKESGGLLEGPPSTVKIVRYFNQTQAFIGGIYLSAACRTLREKRQPLDGVFSELVSANPFIPEGREALFFRGIKAGITLDTVEVSHILIPQVENALRCWWKANGKNITKMNSSGIMKEIDLAAMLESDDASGILGYDITWELRSMLTEKGGPVLRHRIAHGLADLSELHSAIILYFWWLVLHILVVSKLSFTEQDDKSS